MHVLYSYFLYCFSIVFLKQERKGETRETRSSNEGSSYATEIPFPFPFKRLPRKRYIRETQRSIP